MVFMKELLLISCFLLAGLTGNLQDHVITWQDDTLACRFPDKPRKEGIRRPWKYHNGHVRVMTVFANDSVRVLEAGQVKGYVRKKHGIRLLCNGRFESRKMIWPGDRDTSWYFMSLETEGKHASLYKVWEHFNKSPRPYYFVHLKKQKDPHFTLYVSNRKEMRNLLTDEETKEGMEQFYAANKRADFESAVKTFNRLKEEAALRTKK